MDAALANASAGAAVLSQTLTSDAALEEQAKTSQISVGKAALVQQVQALNSALEFDALAALTVEELDQLIHTGAPGMPVGNRCGSRCRTELCRDFGCGCDYPGCGSGAG